MILAKKRTRSRHLAFVFIYNIGDVKVVRVSSHCVKYSKHKGHYIFLSSEKSNDICICLNMMEDTRVFISVAHISMEAFCFFIHKMLAVIQTCISEYKIKCYNTTQKFFIKEADQVYV